MMQERGRDLITLLWPPGGLERPPTAALDQIWRPRPLWRLDLARGWTREALGGGEGGGGGEDTKGQGRAEEMAAGGVGGG